MKKMIGFFIGSLFLLACADDQTARLDVRLTDAPGDFEEVNIDIQEVQINATDSQNKGWKSLEIKKGVYNILELTNGIDTLLSSTELPVGRVSQIRLILGTNNTVKVDGVIKELDTPSGQQSGLKVNLQATLIEGITYTITLDFDAARSIVQRGNGTFGLKPVIRALEEANSGAIKGTVSPVSSAPAVFAIAGTDTDATAYTDAEGKFILRAIPEGTYKVSFDPKDGFTGTTKDNVNVTLGTVTDLGTVIIQ
jgi:hypothetical protein